MNRTNDAESKPKTRGRGLAEIEADDIKPMLEDTISRLEKQKEDGLPVYENKEALFDGVTKYFRHIYKQIDDGIKIIPDVEGLAAFLGVSRATLNRWEMQDYHGMAPIISQAKTEISAYKKQLALHNKIPPLAFTVDMNNNHGYVQQPKEKETVVISRIGEGLSLEEIKNKYMLPDPDIIEGKFVEVSQKGGNEKAQKGAEGVQKAAESTKTD